ncbi:MAG: tetratricopeptide repeat protein [Alphaproteobacteria bacterium]|nr:tetratricopeptide repeat protein [Alphaproteobacteria bacterium]
MAKQGAAGSPAARAQLRAELARLAQQGQFDRAEALCRQLAAASPADPDPHALMAAILLQRGDASAAAQSAALALKLDPRHGNAAFNLGNALVRLERFAEAERAFRQADKAHPGDPDILCNLAAVLLRLGSASDAVAASRRGLSARPRDPALLANLGNALMTLGDAAGAAEAYRDVTQAAPQDADAWRDLSGAYERLWRIDEAIQANERARALQPADPTLRAELMYQLQHACDWPRHEALAREVDRDIDAALSQGQATAEPPLGNIGRCDDPARNVAIARAWAGALERATPRLAPPPLAPPPLAPPRPAQPKERLRIGYLSANFQDHAVGHLTCGLFAAHDRAAVEVQLFSYGRDNGGGYREAIEAGADRFVDLLALSDRQAAEAIRAAGVDILVDLMGWTQGHRQAICAMRPAPVQATFLGFPGSSGAGFFDYAIVDHVVLPADHARLWPEKPVFLPHAYQPNNNAQPIAATGATRHDFCLPADGVVFASFNQPFKITEATFRSWMAILRAVPGSVLWLMHQNDAATRNLKTAAHQGGVAPDRLVFSPNVPKPRHLERLALADLALDTLLYNGHTTTSDCLWAGLPVVALKGRHFAARVSASLLGAIGHAELVADDEAGYERLAVALAQDRPRLAALRASLAAARRSAPLFDTPLFARNLERAYRAMWDRAAAGQPAIAIDLAR